MELEIPDRHTIPELVRGTLGATLTTFAMALAGCVEDTIRKSDIERYPFWPYCRSESALLTKMKSLRRSYHSRSKRYVMRQPWKASLASMTFSEPSCSTLT